jgi:hypothetical protein
MIKGDLRALVNKLFIVVALVAVALLLLLLLLLPMAFYLRASSS